MLIVSGRLRVIDFVVGSLFGMFVFLCIVSVSSVEDNDVVLKFSLSVFVGIDVKVVCRLR